jgi:hypothetical protein
MSSQNSSANNTCRAFVLGVLVIVIVAFLLVIGITEHPSLGIRRHFSTSAPAMN